MVGFANDFVRRVRKRMKTTPILSMSKDSGNVRVGHFASQNMYLPLVRDLQSRNISGTVGILTQTNEEAVILLALLRSRGIGATLMQSSDVFRFSTLAEVRYFMRIIERNTTSPMISDTTWREAKSKTFGKYASSTTLPYLKRCIEVFEKTSKQMYYTDFKEFMHESELDDFCDLNGSSITISTIHKSKGLEFDEVYMLVAGNFAENDDQLRRYYVGLTRAKKDLYIYTNGHSFDGRSQFATHYYDVEDYPLPDEVVLQLTHRDVSLGFFTSRKEMVLSLVGGDLLECHEEYLCLPGTRRHVARFSAKMLETIKLWNERGYVISSASVRFVVAWRPKDAPADEPETAVLLPELTLERVSS